MATEKDWVLKIYKDYFWSCSWCDSYEGAFMYKKPIIDSKQTIDFVRWYEPFLTRNISELTYQDIYDWIVINNKNEWDFDKKEQKKIIKKLCKKYWIDK